ncbi:MAG: DUF4386 domain-containing protein [Bacteroidota bacterium]
MTNQTEIKTLRHAAVVAGLSMLVMAIAAPFAEMYVFPKLIIPGNAEGTLNNILSNPALFRCGVFAFLMTFIADLVATWALYILMRPVSLSLTLLTAWFRLVYTIIALVALTNLVSILYQLNEPCSLSAEGVNTFLIAFKNGWHFGLLIFGIHLGLLGYLVFNSGFMPKYLGILLVISASGYFINALKPFLFPGLQIDIAAFTFFGELIFMIWLLARGYRITIGNTHVK